MELFSFALGVFTGAGGVMIYGTYQMIKLEKNKKELIKKLKEKVQSESAKVITEVEKMQSIKDRLVKATTIADQQNALRAQAEMPSKNSLHSRFKNDIILQIQDLEAQKLSILRTILAEGYDPIITVFREGGVKEEIHLSEYVTQAEATLNMLLPPSPPEPATEASGPRKAGKFVIYTGGKNDDGTTH